MQPDPKRAAAIESEGRFAVDHFARNGVTRRSLFDLLDRYAEAYAAMGNVMLPSPHGGMAAPGCRKGCAFCCHTIVVVTAPEIFYLVEYAARSRDADALAALVERARTTDLSTRGKIGPERWGAGPPCPLLDPQTNACGVYEGRPLSCRGLLSSSRASCETAFGERLSNPRFEGARPFLFQNSDIFLFAFARGLKSASRDLYRLELVAALSIAWSTKDAMERWLGGEDVFRDARAPGANAPIV